MTTHQVFLSVVVVARNQGRLLGETLRRLNDVLSALTTDHEIIVVDNASEDDSVTALRGLAGAGGLPDLQVYALTKEVDADTAAWAGVENALGDYVVVFNPAADDDGQLPAMLEQAMLGHDVVFAENVQRPAHGLAYRILESGFNALYRWASGVDLAKEAPKFRLLSRRVINFVLRHRSPGLAYRYLPATAGFARVKMTYSFTPRAPQARRLADSIEKAMQLLVSSTRAPMRLVTSLSLFGAVANAVYSLYVIAIALLKADVAPGWITLSLQQSGMFFLISLVLWVLGEYILHMVSMINEGPAYHVAQEFTSVVITRREKLNVDEARQPPSPAGAAGLQRAGPGS